MNHSLQIMLILINKEQVVQVQEVVLKEDTEHTNNNKINSFSNFNSKLRHKTLVGIGMHNK